MKKRREDPIDLNNHFEKNLDCLAGAVVEMNFANQILENYKRRK